MVTSQFGVQFIEMFEGLWLVAKRDIAGVPTIGFGHTNMAGGFSFVIGDKISKVEADKILSEDLHLFEVGVDRLIGGVSVTQHQYDALISFAFNAGLNALKTSSLLRALKRGDFEAAANGFLLWNRATVGGEKVVVSGLDRRRKAERSMFLGDVESARALAHMHSSISDVMPQNVLAPEQRKTIVQSGTARAATGAAAATATVAYQGAKEAIQNAQDVKDMALTISGLFGVYGGLALIVGLSLLALGLLAYILWRRYQRSKDELVAPGKMINVADERRLTSAQPEVPQIKKTSQDHKVIFQDNVDPEAMTGAHL